MKTKITALLIFVLTTVPLFSGEIHKKVDDLILKGDFAKAEKIAREAIKKDDAHINYHIAKIYLINKNLSEAKKYLTINSKLDNKDDMYFINKSIHPLRDMGKKKK